MLLAKHTQHIRENTLFGKIIFIGENFVDNSLGADLSLRGGFRLSYGLPHRFRSHPFRRASCIQISNLKTQEISSFNREYSLIVKVPNDLVILSAPRSMNLRNEFGISRDEIFLDQLLIPTTIIRKKISHCTTLQAKRHTMPLSSRVGNRVGSGWVGGPVPVPASP